MAATIDKCVARHPGRPEAGPDVSGKAFRPQWPMIVLRTPKGWTSPSEVGGHKLEGSWRSHQVPMADVKKDPARLKQLEDWMRGYKPQELFDAHGRLQAGAEGHRADRHAADRVQPARQRRAPEEGPPAAGLPQLRHQGREARHDRGRELPAARRCSSAT